MRTHIFDNARSIGKDLMKKLLKIVCMSLAFILIFSMAACGGGGPVIPPPPPPPDTDPGDIPSDDWELIRQKESFAEGSQLRIKFFDGGYGRAWIDAMKEKFEEDYPQVKITLIPSKNEAEFTTLLSTTLDGTPDDIYICHNIPWEKLATQGKIMNLDNVYAAPVYKVEKDDGEERIIRFENRIVSSSLNSAKFWNSALQKYSYYKIPQVQGMGGLAYNKALFDKNGWTIPTTYDELISLCDTISKSGAKNDSGDTVYPFIWSNAVAYMWDSVVFDWWVQLAGMAEYNRFMAFEDKNVFNPEEYPYLKQAWTYWYDMLCANKSWSHPQSLALDHSQANMSFAAGQAAMMPATCWTANEIGYDILEEFGCDIGLIPTPFVEDAKTDDDGNPIRVAYDLAGKDSIVLATKAKNKAVAVEFMTWMAEVENANLFPKHTNGLMLAMNYNYDKLISESELTWEKDMFAIIRDAKRFTAYSASPMVYAAGSPLSAYPEGNYYGEAYEQYPIATRNPDYIFNNVWTMINREWANMRTAVGLS